MSGRSYRDFLSDAISAGANLRHRVVHQLEGMVEGRPIETFREATSGRTGYVDGAEGQRIFWHETGEGSPEFLFIHGLGLTHNVWKFQQETLAADHRVASIDLRGHGQSERGDIDLPIARGAAVDIVRVLTQLDMRNVIIVGHSIGGMSMLEFAISQSDVCSERVIGLVAQSTTATGKNMLETRAYAPFRALLGALDASVVAPAAEAFVRLRALPITDSDLGLFAFREMFGENAEEGAVLYSRELVHILEPLSMLQAMNEIFGHDIVDRLDQIDVPVLVVDGTHDLLLPESESRILAGGISDVEWVPVNGAGHMIMYEESDFLSCLIRGFAHEITA